MNDMIRGPLSEREHDKYLRGTQSVDVVMRMDSQLILDLDTALRQALKERDEAREACEANGRLVDRLRQAHGDTFEDNATLRTRLAEVEKELSEYKTAALEAQGTDEAHFFETKRLRTLAAKQESEGAELRAAMSALVAAQDFEGVPAVPGSVAMRVALKSTSLGTAALACVEALGPLLLVAQKGPMASDFDKVVALDQANESLRAFRRATGQE